MSQIKLYKSYKELSNPYIGKIYINNARTSAFFSVNRIAIHTITKEHVVYLDKLSVDLTVIRCIDYVSFPVDQFFTCIQEKGFIDTGERKLFANRRYDIQLEGNKNDYEKN
jgi:hypothetical protein